MHGEMLVFAAFFGLQAIFHICEKFTHHLEHSKWWERIVHSQLILIVFHPAIMHTIQDYSIHFVVYSGQVIAAH